MKSNTQKILFLTSILFACLLANAQDKKISQLTALPSMTGAEYMPCAISGSNYYLTPNQIKTWLNIPSTLYFNSPLSVSSNTVSLGIVPITKGGTGQVSYTTGDMLYYGGYTNMSILNIGSAGKVLTSNGSVPTWSTITSGTTYTNTSPITITSGTVIGISQSNTSTNGYLSSTDWNTFNGKATLPANAAGALVNNGSGSLSWLGYGSANTNSYLVQRDASGNVTANSFITSGGTSSQYVKGDGSLSGIIQPYGTVLQDNFQRSSIGSSYTSSGTITYSTSPTFGLMLSGGATNFNNVVYNNTGAVNDENYTISANITTVSDNCGVWIGTWSTQPNLPLSYACFINLYNNSSRGSITLWEQGTNVGGSAALTYTTGDVLYLSMTRSNTANFSWTFKAQNITHPTATPAVITYTSGITLTANIQGLGYPAIGLYGGGGSCNISDFKYQNNANINEPYLFVGHSMVVGCSNTLYSTRFANIAMSNLNYTSTQYNVMASQGALVSDGLNAINEVINMHPKKAIVMWGTNENTTGVSVATFTTNYHTYCQDLRAAGIKIVHLLILPNGLSNSSSVPTYNAGIIAEANTYSEPYIDDYTPLVSSGTTPNASFFASDSEHPNTAGHAVIGNLIEEFLYYNP